MDNHTSTILIGYGGHGYVAAEILMLSGIAIAGYCDTEEKPNNPFNISYRKNENIFFSMPGNVENYSAFVAIGSGTLRRKVFENLEKKHVKIINAIHPSAVVSAITHLGKGVFIAANVSVNSCCIIGNGAVCNTGSSIDHECAVGDFSHICPGTILCGNVIIGKNCFIGAGSTIIPGKKISDNIVIGAGSVVINDLDMPGIYAGSPAKLLRSI